MEKLICKECGKEFTYKKLSSCRAKLREHLKIEHQMSLQDYIVKHEYNGIQPMCPCGCGHPLKLANSGDRWRFNQYYSDTCYGRLVKMGNEDIKKKYMETHPQKFDIVKYYSHLYDRETYQKAFDLFKTKTCTLQDVAHDYHIDKRTLKKIWLVFGITTQVELTEITDYMKYHFSQRAHHFDIYQEDSTDNIVWMYNLIKSHPYQYTIRSMIEYYNEKNPEKICHHNPESIYKQLHRIYGNEIDIYLALGYHSQDEKDFISVLSFYFGKNKCRLGKQFVKKDGGYFCYDFFIDSKLLIEYDAEGFFHASEKTKLNDIEKEKFAKENGYLFLRLNSNDIKDINTITKIKNLLNETNSGN